MCSVSPVPGHDERSVGVYQSVGRLQQVGVLSVLQAEELLYVASGVTIKL